MSLDRYIENFITYFDNLIRQFEVDKIEINEEHINYYKNYYLKGIVHEDFTTLD